MLTAYGTYTGNGTDNHAITGVGFQPDLVIVKSEDTAEGDDSVFKTSDMAGNLSLPMRFDNAGTTDGIKTLDSDGFTLGTGSTHNDSNTNTGVYQYIAVRDDGAGDFTVFTYTGNSTDNRTVTGFGFAPCFACVKGDIAKTGAYKYDEAPDDQGQVFFSGGAQTWIRSLDADGITTDASDFSNASSTEYYGFAFKAVTGQTETLSYTGNGTDNNSITTGHQPEWVWIKGASGNSPRFRTTAFDTNESVSFDSSVVTNAIKSFGSTSFTLGTDGTVNTNTSDYYALNIGAPLTGIASSRMLVGTGQGTR